jgi:hypothetical protein
MNRAWRISDQEPRDWDWAADKEIKKMTTPDRPTCKVCMADLANGDPHEPWCTLGKKGKHERR